MVSMLTSSLLTEHQIYDPLDDQTDDLITHGDASAGSAATSDGVAAKTESTGIHSSGS